MQHPLLIDTNTLQQRLGQPGLVIIDVRGGRPEFGGHIPGAVHPTCMITAIPKPWRKDCWIQIETDREARQALGINQDSDVVIYSNPFDNWGDEGRMFWMLEYLGHTHLTFWTADGSNGSQESRPFEHGACDQRPGLSPSVRSTADHHG